VTNVTEGYIKKNLFVLNYSPQMVNEQQKYLSTLLRILGLALLTPIGSLLFQWLILRKSIFDSHCIITTLVAILGALSLYFGYTTIREKDYEY
jgi:hypothetical protein